jgi:hypothetical protein
MKWFKHSTESASSDSAGTQVIETHGLEGYGRYMLLIEILIRPVTSMDEIPSRCTSVKQWAQILKMKQKNVIPFLEYLHNLRTIVMECIENQVSVILHNPERLLSDKAISSKMRAPPASPRLDKNIFKEIDPGEWHKNNRDGGQS